MTRRSLVRDALVGASVTALLVVVPFSGLLGGGVAGYLHGTDGARTGLLAGVFGALPKTAVAIGAGSLFGVVAVDPLSRLLLAVFVAYALLAVYDGLLAALGGHLGAYLFQTRRSSADVDRRTPDSGS